MKSKKSMAVSTLVMIIIVMLSAIVIFGFYNKAQADIKGKSAEEACRSSISAISTATEQSSGFIGTLKLNCPASHTDYKKEDYNDYVVSVASELNKCWYKTIGSSNRLGKNYKMFIDWLSADSDICVVCSTFTLNDGIESRDIIAFLDEKNAKVTSWDNEHIFIDITKQGNIRTAHLASYMDLAEYRSYYNDYPTSTIESMLDSITSLDYLEKGKSYYVISNHAAHSRADDFNMVFVISEDDLKPLKCDAFFHQIKK